MLKLKPTRFSSYLNLKITGDVMKRETNKIIKSGGEPLFVGDDPVDQFPVN